MSAATSMAAAPATPTKSGRDFFGVFKDLKQTVTNGWVAVRPPPVEEETDTRYLAHKAKLEDLEQHLVTASQQVTDHFCNIQLPCRFALIVLHN